ncbi:MAG: AMP-binding protein, partial [Cyclobacteriaceae bacterium]
MSIKIQTLSGYFHEYQKSILDPEAFWSRVAESFYWRKKWDKVVEWDFDGPDVKWFVNGKLNITENIFERHLFTIGDRPAIIWEPNEPSEPSRTITYKELHVMVCETANVLLANGVKKGDRVIIYMPMVPEAAVAMLACARIGAVHSVVFAGFSANSLTDRIQDCGAKMIITADGGYRGAKTTPIKSIVDESLTKDTNIEKVLVLKRTGENVSMKEGRDIWWHDAHENVNSENVAEEMDAEDMLFILYTSGSTGKPKGVVHTCGGYMTFSQFTFQNVFQYSV